MSAVFNHADPEVTAQRLDRIAEASPRMRTRLADMRAARDLRKKHQILSAWELNTELNSLMSAMVCAGASDMERYRTALAEIASDLENELLGGADSLREKEESQ